MKRTLRVLPDAEAELQSAASWYEEKRRGLGIELIAVVDRAFQSILENPEAFPAWRPDRPYRTRLLKRFPYVVFFRIDAATIENRCRRAREATSWLIGWIVCVRRLGGVTKRARLRPGSLMAVTPTMRSRNSVIAFLRDWNALRRV